MDGSAGRMKTANGPLRQWFPRSTNFYDLDPDDIARVEQSLNQRQRRTRGFKTPADVSTSLSV